MSEHKGTRLANASLDLVKIFLGCSAFVGPLVIGFDDLASLMAGLGEFNVGNGSRVRFWDDVWVGREPLKLEFEGIYNISSMKNGVFKDMVVGLEVTFIGIIICFAS
ncbi:hypothetical protein IFM89_005638 [Coptis chinensis]|uniref:Uncharacterized protein n=1 Tax=Coptis chinensis TaxID=261450 RepID=A0A835IRP5_9MAGN|nr:hypothetical protein IFM89_005638 [Coptis chinensis]